MLDDVKWYSRLPLIAFQTCHQVDQCAFVLVALQYFFFFCTMNWQWLGINQIYKHDAGRLVQH